MTALFTKITVFVLNVAVFVTNMTTSHFVPYVTVFVFNVTVFVPNLSIFLDMTVFSQI